MMIEINNNKYLFLHAVFRKLRQFRSQWPHGLTRESEAVGLRVRILPAAWMSVSCGCCISSGRGLCVGLITRPEESYRV
jgi:hypothetical protein